MKLTIPKFNKIKSECKICIGSKMCPEHLPIWEKLMKDIKAGK